MMSEILVLAPVKSAYILCKEKKLCTRDFLTRAFHFSTFLAATTFLKSNPTTKGNDEAFKSACGIDVSYTPDQIESCVSCIWF